MILRFIIHLMGGEIMMAVLLAQRVILGKMTFAEIPEVLQPAVEEVLVESGLGFLAK